MHDCFDNDAMDSKKKSKKDTDLMMGFSFGNSKKKSKKTMHEAFGKAPDPFEDY